MCSKIFNSALQPFNNGISSPLKWLLGKIFKTYFVHSPLCTVKFSYCSNLYSAHYKTLCKYQIYTILFSGFAETRYLKCIEISIQSILILVSHQDIEIFSVYIDFFFSNTFTFREWYLTIPIS